MSLKDALLKAGLKSSKTENEREQKREKDKKKVEKHQETRNFCEVCELTQPDVERYNHRNALIDARWICSNCADKNQILDDFRQTHQSEFAKAGRFRRYYGPTKDFKKEGDFKSSKPGGPNRQRDGRRNNRNENSTGNQNRGPGGNRKGPRKNNKNGGPNKGRNFNS